MSVISCLVFELITLNEEAVRTTKATLMYRRDVIGLSFFRILVVTIIMNYHALLMHQSVLRVNTGGRKYQPRSKNDQRKWMTGFVQILCPKFKPFSRLKVRWSTETLNIAGTNITSLSVPGVVKFVPSGCYCRGGLLQTLGLREERWHNQSLAVDDGFNLSVEVANSS